MNEPMQETDDDDRPGSLPRRSLISRLFAFLRRQRTQRKPANPKRRNRHPGSDANW